MENESLSQLDNAFLFFFQIIDWLNQFLRMLLLAVNIISAAILQEIVWNLTFNLSWLAIL